MSENEVPNDGFDDVQNFLELNETYICLAKDNKTAVKSIECVRSMSADQRKVRLPMLYQYTLF